LEIKKAFDEILLIVLSNTPKWKLKQVFEEILNGKNTLNDKRSITLVLRYMKLDNF
jgi:hypothetical protein